MKNLLIPAVLVLCFSLPAFSQITETEDKLRNQNQDTIYGWKTGGMISINLSQTSLTNWAAGGMNSLSINSLLTCFANYKSKNSVWDNSLDIGYGLLKQGESKNFMKTDDKIDLLSKYGKEAFRNFYYAALFNFKTQMAPGYNYPNDTDAISNLFAPAYFLGALGMDYKPNSYFSLFLAPVTAKITIVNDQDLADAGAFGVTPAEYDLTTGEMIIEGEKIKNEFGGYLRFIYSRNDFKNELLKNISFTTKLDLFSNYLEDPDHIDVSWENLLAFKVNKFISVNFTTHLLYDHDTQIPIDRDNDGISDDTGPRTQFKEILSVGFSYKF